MAKKYEHENHRSRMREKYAARGAETLSDEELLEMLLYYSIPRVDTAPIAAKLLETFGSYSAVLDANEKALLNIEGMGRHTVEFLGFFRSFLNRYKSSEREKPVKVGDVSSLLKYIESHMKDLEKEMIYIGILGKNGEVLYGTTSDFGDNCEVDVSIRKIAELCLSQQAHDYFLVHNHPSGISVPSKTDIRNSLIIENALTHMGCIMCDHLIYGIDGFCSMRESGMLLRLLTKEQLKVALTE